MKRLRSLHANSATPSRKHPVRLSDGECRELRQLLGAGTASARTLAQARILL